MSRAQNFVSAVVCLDGAGEEVFRFLNALAAQLEAHFSQYEIIAVGGSLDSAGGAAPVGRRAG